MQITRTSGFAALTAAAALLLSACGSTATPAPSSAASAASAGGGAASSEMAGPATDTSSAADTSGADSSAAGTSEAMSSGGSSAPAGDAPTFDSAGFKCATGDLRSSGSTAQGKVIGAWIKAYNEKCGATINDYGGGGSGKGITDFTSDQTDFGGSDSALKDTEKAPAMDRCKGNPAIDLPMVTGPIAVAYKLEGVTDLTLTPALLAQIFDDKIISWDDPAIAAVNPGVTLPATAIQTVHRSEDSGTTDNFVKYLKANSDWPYDGGKAWQAAGGTGANGSDGVASQVAGSDGSIGYIEWGFATDKKLPVAKIDNGGGAVELNAESVGKAVGAAKQVGEGSDLALELDYATKEAGAYPIILVTYEVICSKGNGDKAALLKSFLGWAATDGQALTTDLGSAPLPASIQTKVIDAVTALT